MTEIGRNIDGYSFSFFFHKDRNGKLKAGPLWDWDLGFGNCRFYDGHRLDGWQFEKVAGLGYEWYKRLFEAPDFLQRYIDRWAELRTNVLATFNIHARIDQLTAQLTSDAIARNYKRWPTLGEYVFPNAFTGKTYQEEAVWLKGWIGGRLAWIETQDFPAPIVHARSLSNNEVQEGQTEITFGWLVGQVFYTVDGSDPRLCGGSVSAKAIEYKRPVALAAGAQLRARVRSEHGLWSALRNWSTR
jgi:hypothetical protein